MAWVANQAMRDMSHKVDKKVWLATKKLVANWPGPFEVVECVCPVAYMSKLPDDWQTGASILFVM